MDKEGGLEEPSPSGGCVDGSRLLQVVGSREDGGGERGHGTEMMSSVVALSPLPVSLNSSIVG